MRERETSGATCCSCRYFEDDPHRLEAALTGILALSSTYGSTRGRAGICSVRGTFQDPEPACPEFQPRSATRTTPHR